MTILYIVLVYLLVINLIAFGMYGVDKVRAVKNKWRISEYALIMVCVIGGSIGGLLGMKVFRHKTKHKKFTIGVPFILILHLLAICAVAGWFGMNVHTV